MRVGVTGASGLVGSHLVPELERRGHVVLRLSRPDFRLGAPVSATLLQGADALVHCAYDFQALGVHEVRRINVDGSLSLLEAAIAAGVGRLVFVSSIAAFEDCRTIYGRGKLEVEAAFRRAEGVIVRPGLIHGDAAGRGMFGALGRVVRLPIVPMLGDGSFLFYLVHVEDLVCLLADIVELYDEWRGRTMIAANPTPVRFRDLIKRIARAQKGREVVTIPVPVSLGLLLLRTLERAGLRPRFRSDSLVSMVHYDPSPPFGAELESRFRAFT